MPMNSNLLTAFIAITSVAVVLQMLILLGIYLTMRRSTSQVHDIAMDFQRRATPLIENARDLLADATPKRKEPASNPTQASAVLHKPAAPPRHTAVEMEIRAKNKVVAADDIMTRTLERVEKTTGAVQNSVLFPVRRVNGILHGISAGIGAFLNQKREVREEQQRNTNDEGMFV